MTTLRTPEQKIRRSLSPNLLCLTDDAGSDGNDACQKTYCDKTDVEQDEEDEAEEDFDKINKGTSVAETRKAKTQTLEVKGKGQSSYNTASSSSALTASPVASSAASTARPKQIALQKEAGYQPRPRFS